MQQDSLVICAPLGRGNKVQIFVTRAKGSKRDTSLHHNLYPVGKRKVAGSQYLVQSQGWGVGVEERSGVQHSPHLLTMSLNELREKEKKDGLSCQESNRKQSSSPERTPQYGAVMASRPFPPVFPTVILLMGNWIVLAAPLAQKGSLRHCICSIQWFQNMSGCKPVPEMKIAAGNNIRDYRLYTIWGCSLVVMAVGELMGISHSSWADLW